MITREAAHQLVLDHLGRQDGLPPNDEWVVIDEATIEKPWGWVFFQTSKLWRETGDLQYAVVGNSPLLVVRESGQVFSTGTAHAIEHYIANYERYSNPQGLHNNSGDKR